MPVPTQSLPCSAWLVWGVIQCAALLAERSLQVRALCRANAVTQGAAGPHDVPALLHLG